MKHVTVVDFRNEIHNSHFCITKPDEHYAKIFLIFIVMIKLYVFFLSVLMNTNLKFKSM